MLSAALLVSLAPASIPAVAAAEAADAPTRCGTHAWCDPSLPADVRASMVLAEMTLDEKAAFVGGESLGSNGGLGDTPLSDNPALNRDHTGSSAGIERLGVPAVFYADGPAAVRQGSSTLLPSPTALAATFDEDSARAYGGVIGTEAKLKGNDAVFGPTVNMVRTPLNSRLVEAYGEDPYLTSRTGVGWITGLQGQGVMSVVKHFAGYNSEGQLPFATGSRVTPLDSVIDERTLREIYLPQFEAAVNEAEAASVMCSYNKLNGTYACENGPLL
ncbi:MAG TPA: glycoside hydrolase family 3 N-terminal domain-containing protein, partial [Mycobacteriales bacterium]|nr:glycoside hydrolase family 3 N-terminal domain-containing protein [Mycobacteriales bacterium]